VTERLGVLPGYVNVSDDLANPYYEVDLATAHATPLFSTNLRKPPNFDLGIVDHAVWSARGTVIAQVQGAGHWFFDPQDEYRVVEIDAASGKPQLEITRSAEPVPR
jgi:hypothetical protein